MYLIYVYRLVRMGVGEEGKGGVNCFTGGRLYTVT